MRVGAKVLSANSFAKTVCRNDFAELRGAKRGQTDELSDFAAGGVQVRQEGWIRFIPLVWRWSLRGWKCPPDAISFQRYEHAGAF